MSPWVQRELGREGNDVSHWLRLQLHQQPEPTCVNPVGPTHGAELRGSRAIITYSFISVWLTDHDRTGSGEIVHPDSLYFITFGTIRLDP